MSAFKQKPNKVKHLTTVRTLDELHREKMANFSSNFEKLEYFSKTGDLLMTYYDIVQGSYYNSDVSETKSDKKNESEQKSDDVSVAIEISQGLKKLNELSQKNRKTKKQIKKRRLPNNNKNQKSILQFMGDDDEENDEKTDTQSQQQPILPTYSINRATLQDKYLTIIDKNYACTKVKSSKIVICNQCNIEKILDQSGGCYVCKSCGETECIIMENETAGHKDSTNDKQKYPYKRMNHLKEKLNQFQSKETADVPDIVYEKIFAELKKKRIKPDDASSKDIKAILKKNHMTNFYEHLQQIYCKITSCPPMTLTREIEEAIVTMFQTMQESFQTHCPKTRENFLNYSYVLNKLFRIIGLDKYSKYFGLLKSKEKLRGQDVIWTKICKDMNWPYHTSF